MKEEIKTIADKIAEAELVLVGIGEKFAAVQSVELLTEAYGKLAALLEGKNYFVITLCTDEAVYEAGLREDRIVRPLAEEESGQQEAGETRPSRWDTYMKWLQGTLHKRLLVLELGVGLKYPQIIRFPFEKTVYFNQKAELVRVHDKLFQLPAELSGRGSSIPVDAVSLLKNAEI